MAPVAADGELRPHDPEKGPDKAVPRRRVTIRDVARASFTSVATVSVALSGGSGVAAETRAHVQEVADRLGWRPNRYASNLRKTDSRLIGFVCEVEQVFQMGLVDSLYVAAQRKGLELVLAGATAHHDERTCVDESLRARCQAIILTGSGLTEAEMSELAGAVPLVSLCRLVHAPGVNVVVSDDRMGLGQAVDHLADLGHRRIFHVDGGPRYLLAESRSRAYLAAMQARGLADHARVIEGGSTAADGVRAAGRVLDCKPLPTAVICFNDASAAALVRELNRQGVRVPADISVVGFDDTEMAAEPSTSLTTIVQDPRRLAEAAIDLVAARINGPQGPGDNPASEELVVLPTELRVRKTTAPPKR